MSARHAIIANDEEAQQMIASGPDMDWELGATRLFGNYDLGKTGMISGWSNPEDPHVWNDGPEAVFQLSTASVKHPLRLTFEGVPFIGGRCTFQDVVLYVNGARLGFWRLREPRSQLLSAIVEPEHMFERRGKTVLNCIWHLPQSVRPVGVGKDTRELGFCFRSITVSVFAV
jgi:hypothetical protein